LINTQLGLIYEIEGIKPGRYEPYAQLRARDEQGQLIRCINYDASVLAAMLADETSPWSWADHESSSDLRLQG
jgi:hypothetical protein